MHGLTPGPSPSTVPPLCSLGRLLSTSQGAGTVQVGAGQQPERKSWLFLPIVGEMEHPRSLAPAAVIGTPHPSTHHHPFPTPEPCFFVCVNCAIFILFLSLLFSQRNKCVEIVGLSLVLVIRMEERALPGGWFSALFLRRLSCSYPSCCHERKKDLS